MKNILLPPYFYKLNNNGMSLFEILIAIAVLSFMMLGIINFTQTTLDTTERVTREDSEYLQIETAMSRFEWDISQLYSPLYFDHLLKPSQMAQSEAQISSQIMADYQNNRRFKKASYNGIPVPEYKLEDKSTLIVFTSSNRRKIQDSKQSHFAWVKYSLVPNDEQDDDDAIQKTTKERQKSSMLIRQVSNHDIYNTDDIPWDDIKQQVLHRKINKLSFELWDPKKFKWSDNIRTIENGNNIIYAIRVSIEFFNADNLPQETVRIFRPIYPSFTPEDMYKFLNAKIPKKTDQQSSNESSENPFKSPPPEDLE